MLAALLLLGLLPAAFLLEAPPGAGHRGADDDWPDDGSSGDASSGGGYPAGNADETADAADGGPAGGGPAGSDAAADEAEGGEAVDSEPGGDEPADDEPADEQPMGGDKPADDASLVIAPNSGDALIEGFRPGIDSLTLHVSGPHAGFYITGGDSAGDGAALHVEEDDAERTVTFAGLDTVPAGDILVSMIDPVSGVEQLGTLVAGKATPLASPAAASDGAAGGELAASSIVATGDDTGAPLTPLDPEAPSEITPADPDDAAPILPLDPEAPSETTPADPDDAAPILPLDPEAPSEITPADPDDAAPIQPVPPETPPVAAPAGYLDGYDEVAGSGGDDTLIFGDGDLVHGGGGINQFHLYTAGTDPAMIDDFAPRSDFLRITLDARQHTSMPEITVGPTEDGADGEVRVAGAIVAILKAAPDVTAEDVYVELLPDMVA